MSVLGEFERRLERAVEGFFARVFRSGVHPVEVGKRLLRVMEDGRVVTLRRTYVPNAYRITLSEADYGRLAPLEAKLVEELEVFVSETAQSRDWSLAEPPRVSFASGPRLSPGEFRIDAQTVSVPAQPAKPAAQPPMRGGKATLRIVDQRDAALVPVTGTIRLGRQSDNDIVLTGDPGVSRHHAEVVAAQDGGYVLRDLGSTNGTTVNGAAVREHDLRDGDRIGLGHTVIEFRATR